MDSGYKVWRPVASCGDELHPSRFPIEEDKMTRCLDLRILAPGSGIPGACGAGGQDPSTSAAWPLVLAWLAGLMSSFGACFEGEGWELEGTGYSRLGGVV